MRETWTKQRVALLRKLWTEDGLSAAQCAERLGGVSRNAVLSKVHRDGFAERGCTPRRKPRKRAKMDAPKPPHAQKQKAPPAPRGNPALRAIFQADPEPFEPAAEEIVIPPHERKQLKDLEEHHCRWPIGDPQESDFHFCARRKVFGLPYCEHHARRAYQVPKTKRRTREDIEAELRQHRESYKRKETVQ